MIKKSAKVRILALCLGLSFSVGAAWLLSQETAEGIYEAALLKKEAEGDLQGAIQLFQKMLKQFPDKREVAAKALLQIGLCYEKLGNAEATKAYETILKNYADRPEEIAIARERLAALRLEEGTGIIKRNLPISDIEFNPYDLSPDGTKIVGISSDIGDNIAVLDIASGRTEVITHFDDGPESFSADNCIWSSDGREIAFTQYPNNDETPYELKAIGLDGRSRVLFRFEDGDIRPCNWLRDGQGIVVLRTNNKEKSCTLGIVNLSRRTFKPLCSIPAGSPWWWLGVEADTSPDGRYIAYHDLNTGNRNIHIFSLARQQSTVVVDHPANDASPRWSPDGKYLVFKSNRHGSYALWGQEMNEGRAVGEPFMIKEAPPEIKLLSWNPQGLACYEYLDFYDVFVQSFDPQAKKLIGKPQILSYAPVGGNFCPRWSPDGKLLAFFTRTNEDPPQLKVIVMASDGKDLREFPVPRRTVGLTSLPLMHFFSWLADSSGIWLPWYEGPGKSVLKMLDVPSGTWSSKALPESAQSSLSIVLDRSGKSIIVIQVSYPGPDAGIYEYDLETGKGKCLYRAGKTSTFAYGLSFSRDFRSLAFAETEYGRNEKDSKSIFKILDIDSSVVHPYYSGPEEIEAGFGPAFSPDGQYLLHLAKDESGWQKALALIPAAGRPLQKFKLDFSWPRGVDLNNRLVNLDWSPDGKQIAFTAWSIKEEMYLLKNIIPTTQKK